MTRATSYHSWNVPEAGDSDYETTFDALFDILDIEIVEKGVETDRPAAGTEDRWYLATDTLNLFYDDGAAWNQLTSGSDADTVDGYHGSDLAARAEAETITGDWTFDTALDNTDLANSSVTVAGNSVALGSSTVVEFADLTNIGAGFTSAFSVSSSTVDLNTVASGTVTLSGGAATVGTGVTTTGTHLSAYLDPSGGGANTVDVKVSARLFWDNSAGEMKLEILEDGTSVENPDIGYEVVRS